MSEMRELTTTELDEVSGGGGFFLFAIGNDVGNHIIALNNQSGVNNGVNVLGSQTATQTNVNFI
jgi:bacteriocin-like protein